MAKLTALMVWLVSVVRVIEESTNTTIFHVVTEKVHWAYTLDRRAERSASHNASAMTNESCATGPLD